MTCVSRQTRKKKPVGACGVPPKFLHATQVFLFLCDHGDRMYYTFIQEGCDAMLSMCTTPWRFLSDEVAPLS